MTELQVVKALIAKKFPSMRGFTKTTVTYVTGPYSSLTVEVEAVTGTINRNKPATAVYLWFEGDRWRYNGKRWSKS